MITKLRIGTLLALFFLSVTVACIQYNVNTSPEAFPFPSESTFEIEEGVDLSIYNAYIEYEKVEILPNSGVTGMPKQYTETIIAAAERELMKKGLQISPSASKSITLKVVDPICKQLMMITCQLSLEVELGSGDRFIIDVVNSTGGNIWRAINGATHKASVSLLQDDRLAAYLRNN